MDIGPGVASRDPGPVPPAVSTEVSNPPVADGPAGLSPRVRQLWRFQALIFAVVLAVAATAVTLVASPPVVVTVLVVVVGLGAVGLAWYLPAVAHRRWRYEVTPDHLELRHGVVVLRQSSIPHFRVQHIDIRQGPIERLLGISTLAISTASPATDAQLPGVEPSHAEAIRRAVLERVEADDGV